MRHAKRSRPAWPAALLTLCLLSWAAPALTLQTGRPACPDLGGRPVTLELLVCALRTGNRMDAKALADTVAMIERRKVDFELTTAALEAIVEVGIGKLTPQQLAALLDAVRRNYSRTPTPPQAPRPAVAFCAYSNFISAGELVRLRWETVNATSVEIRPQIPGADRLSGETFAAPHNDTTFSLLARGPGGNESRQVRVSVAAAAASVELEWVTSEAFLEALREVNAAAEGDFGSIVNSVRWPRAPEGAEPATYCSKVALPALSCRIVREKDGNSFECESRKFNPGEAGYGEKVYEAIKHALRQAAPPGSAADETTSPPGDSGALKTRLFHVKYGPGGWRGWGDAEAKGDNAWKLWPGARLSLKPIGDGTAGISLSIQGANKNRPPASR